MSGILAMTRSGASIKVLSSLMVYQIKTHYGVLLKLKNGFSLELKLPVPNLLLVEVKDEVQVEASKVLSQTESTSPILLNAQQIPSAGGAMVASVKPDEYAHEKVKGETFFIHKTSPGLIIKRPDGSILHDVKMDDMYKRR